MFASILCKILQLNDGDAAAHLCGAIVLEITVTNEYMPELFSQASLWSSNPAVKVLLSNVCSICLVPS